MSRFANIVGRQKADCWTRKGRTLDEAMGGVTSPFNVGNLKSVHFHILVENIPDGIAIFDSSMNLVSANRTYFEITGLPADQFADGFTYPEILERLARRGWYGDKSPEEVISSRMAAMMKGKKRTLDNDDADGDEGRYQECPFAGRRIHHDVQGSDWIIERK